MDHNVTDISPVHTKPSPTYPGLHLHVKPPGLLWHSPHLAWHVDTLARSPMHSFMSVKHRQGRIIKMFWHWNRTSFRARMGVGILSYVCLLNRPRSCVFSFGLENTWSLVCLAGKSFVAVWCMIQYQIFTKHSYIGLSLCQDGNRLIFSHIINKCTNVIFVDIRATDSIRKVEFIIARFKH